MGTTVYSPKDVLAIRVSVSGADGTVTATRALLVIDALVQSTAVAAGAAITIQNNGTAITDAIDASTATGLGRATSITSAQQAVAAGGTINVARTSTPTAEVFIYCLSN